MTVPYMQSNDSTSQVKLIEPINLRDQFPRYRVTYDPAYAVEDPRYKKKEESWLQKIEGRHGFVYPQGGDLLIASTFHIGSVAKRLASLPGCQISQDGSDGMDISFPLKQFAAVAKILCLHTRRKLSETQKQALKKAGEKYRFLSKMAKTITRPEAVSSCHSQTK